MTNDEIAARLAAVEVENRKLRDDLSRLVNPPAPPPRVAPRDYSSGLAMPATAAREMIAVGDATLRGLREDRRGVPNSGGSMAPIDDRAEPVRRSRAVPSNNGWVDATPLPSKPPGDAAMARLTGVK